MITAAMTSLKTAMDIAKILKEATTTLEQAEVKFKLADLMLSLADAKVGIAEASNALIEKDAEIAKLKSAFAMNQRMVFVGGAYVLVDSQNKLFGQPYCSRCWEVDQKLVHLILNPAAALLVKCPECNTDVKYCSNWYNTEAKCLE
jgi:endogenous inhibitor of DNA gyrase (YacG/DUF329 family)